jgi:hypothetical protein
LLFVFNVATSLCKVSISPSAVVILPSNETISPSAVVILPSNETISPSATVILPSKPSILPSAVVNLVSKPFTVPDVALSIASILVTNPDIASSLDSASATNATSNVLIASHAYTASFANVKSSAFEPTIFDSSKSNVNVGRTPSVFEIFNASDEATDVLMSSTPATSSFVIVIDSEPLYCLPKTVREFATLLTVTVPSPATVMKFPDFTPPKALSVATGNVYSFVPLIKIDPSVCSVNEMVFSSATNFGTNKPPFVSIAFPVLDFTFNEIVCVLSAFALATITPLPQV